MVFCSRFPYLPFYLILYRVTIGITLSKSADISYNIASKYDVQICKRLHLLGDFGPGTLYRGPWTRWELPSPRTPAFLAKNPPMN